MIIIVIIIVSLPSITVSTLGYSELKRKPLPLLQWVFSKLTIYFETIVDSHVRHKTKIPHIMYPVLPNYHIFWILPSVFSLPSSGAKVYFFILSSLFRKLSVVFFFFLRVRLVIISSLNFPLLDNVLISPLFLRLFLLDRGFWVAHCFISAFENILSVSSNLYGFWWEILCRLNSFYHPFKMSFFSGCFQEFF